MKGDKRIWKRYFEAEMRSRYWSKQSRRCSALRAALSLAILFFAIAPALSMGLGLIDSPWFLTGCGVAVAAIGWFAAGRFGERAALACVAHSVWGGLSSQYRVLWERSQKGGEVTDKEVEAIVGVSEIIAALTRNEFKESNRRLVVESEGECYEFFGVRPPSAVDQEG